MSVGSARPAADIPICRAGEPERPVVGNSELAQLMRAFDWAATPLGAAEDWPQSLKTAVRIMLTSRQPIWIGWGAELIYLYNDPYKSIIGGKHPWALGQPTSEVWREIWDDIGPMLATAMGGDEGTYVEAQLLIMERNGYPEETYYTFSYSPIPNDDGTAGGIICANTDDTQRVIGERQLALLRELAARDRRRAHLASRPASAAPQALATNPRDLPFALLYLVEPGGSERDARRRDAGSTATIPRVAPQRCRSTAPMRLAARRGARASTSRASSPISTTAFGATLPDAAPGSSRRRRRSCCRSPPSGETGRAGVLVVGLNPFRLFDDDYRGFLDLVGRPDRRRASPTPRPTRRSAGAPRRWPRSTAPRPRSSPTSATSSARR